VAHTLKYCIRFSLHCSSGARSVSDRILIRNEKSDIFSIPNFFSSNTIFREETAVARIIKFKLGLKRYGSRCVERVFSGSSDFVGLCMRTCPRPRRKTARAIKTKLGPHILYGRISVCVDRAVKQSKVNVRGYEVC